ncbi:MAG: hypothetical protein AN486_17765 [Anabaena sp. AL93]|nr:MAG: hypothetical protein AN486_17765 [Anabaena sp. AL93]
MSLPKSKFLNFRYSSGGSQTFGRSQIFGRRPCAPTGSGYTRFEFNVGVAPPCLPLYLGQPQGLAPYKIDGFSDFENVQ